ncbi:hypothetical protein E1171_17510 [Cytophagales bacterium RKSG123]|nr:hypothetical protein [Xanthovirga aplysinae]
MSQNIKALYQATSVEQLQEVVNRFDRIAQKEKEEWLPRYYMGLGYIFMGTGAENGTLVDNYLDKALDQIQQMEAMEKDRAEVLALEGFLHMIRLTVDPASRGQKYSGLSLRALNKAQEIAPQNPRVLLLLGQMQMGVAQFFGQDNSEACGLISIALELFDSVSVTGELMPTWGKKSALDFQKKCKG